MRQLTAVGAATVILAAGVGMASTAGADPSTAPSSTAPATEAPATPSATPSATTAPGPTATDYAAPPSTSTAATSPASATATTTLPAGEHQVTYTITTTSDLTANIYYMAADAPSQAAANDPKFMPIARTTVGPGSPWTLQTTLKDPTRWAFVSASGGLRVNPEFHCEITVDGQVVTSQQGGSGVQCALRPW